MPFFLVSLSVVMLSAPAVTPTASAAAVAPQAAATVDWHTHLSLEPAGVFDSLLAHGVRVVRDCGGDLDSLLAWRQAIATGRRRGPRLYIAGPLLDGVKPDAPFRLTVTDAASAERAVDSLAQRGVDFLKVHNAVAPATVYALLRRARGRGLPVALHLPRGVPAWTAVDSGAASIEHAAESLLASPIYAGVASDAAGAVAWWRSPAADSVIAVWARRRVVVVPTLARYEASIASAATPALREQRAALLPELLALVGRMARAGVRLATGTDLTGLPGAPATWVGVDRERALLAQAGLSAAEVAAASGEARLITWFADFGPPAR